MACCDFGNTHSYFYYGKYCFLGEGERKIPVQYTRRVVGQRMYGGQSTYIPFKVNTAGVMPVIFTSAVLNIPVFIASFLATRFDIFKPIYESLSPSGLLYSVLTFVLIIFFSFFYTALQFNPEELAEILKKAAVLFRVFVQEEKQQNFLVIS